MAAEYQQYDDLFQRTIFVPDREAKLFELRCNEKWGYSHNDDIKSDRFMQCAQNDSLCWKANEPELTTEEASALVTWLTKNTDVWSRNVSFPDLEERYKVDQPLDDTTAQEFKTAFMDLHKLLLNFIAPTRLNITINEMYKSGRDIPPYHVSMIELKMTDHEKMKYMPRYEKDRSLIDYGENIEEMNIWNAGLERRMNLWSFDIHNGYFNEILQRIFDDSLAGVFAKVNDDALHAYIKVAIAEDPSLLVDELYTRIMLAKWLLRDSVKMRYGVLKALGNKSMGCRVVFIMRWSMNSKKFARVLRLLGFKVEEITTQMALGDRIDTANRFNDSSTDIDVLLCSGRIAGIGIELHKTCNKGYIFELPDSLATIFQIFGTMYRLGAKQEQFWEIVTVTESSDSLILQKIADKARNQWVAKTLSDEILQLAGQKLVAGGLETVTQQVNNPSSDNSDAKKEVEKSMREFEQKLLQYLGQS